MQNQQQFLSPPHLKQLAQLFKRQYYSQIVLQPAPPTYLIPALLACKMYEESTIQVMRGELNHPMFLLWYVVGSHMIGMNSDEQQEALKQWKEEKYLDMAEDWVAYTKPLSHKRDLKILMRMEYEKLLQKTEQQNYFTLKNVPVFLIPIEWLEKFYNESMDYIPAIDNQQLTEPMPFIETDSKFMHLNYKVKDNKRENVDFKIISFQTWKFLKSKFGGVEIRRFNTPEKEPNSEIWLKEIRVMVTQNRYIHTNWVMKILVSKFDTIAKVVERVQRLMIAYEMINFEGLRKKWEIIKLSKIDVEDLVDLIQDQEKQLSKDYAINEGSRIERLQFIYNIEESQFFEATDILLMTIDTDEKNFIKLDDIPHLKVFTTRQACLTCEKTDDLFQCTCKTVYFCCKECKQKNREHEKACKALMKEELQFGKLIDHYAVKRKTVEYNHVKKYGKVGFQNLGNTCYFNSALQCVLAIDKFNEYFAQNKHLNDLNITNVLGSQGHLACAYGQLVKDYFTTNRRALEPIKVLKIISKNSQFRGHGQQDSQQFLNYFLDKLHEDLNKVKKKPYIEEIESDGRSDELVSAESWENYLKRNQSFIAERIAGQYRSEIRCPDCDRVSITFDPFMSVTLPFPKEFKTTDVVGYYLTDVGEFTKVKTEVKKSMLAKDFYEKYFHENVVGQWLQDKKPTIQWKENKSVFHNTENKGILLFYRKDLGCDIGINIKLEGYNVFNRRVYVEEMESKEELMKVIYMNIKMPLLKAIEEDDYLDIGNEEYLEKCMKMGFIQFLKEPKKFPLADGEHYFEVAIKAEKMTDWKLQKSLKFDVSSRAYSPKEKIKVRSINDEVSVSYLMESFNEPERLTTDNTWYCNKCKDHKLAEKIMSIYKLPEILILHLKRFNHKGNRYVIYGQKVKTPIELQPTEIINGKKYELIGVVNHYGTLTFGHYTAYVKRDGDWFYCDDSSVKKGRVSGDNAYLLFYKEIK